MTTEARLRAFVAVAETGWVAAAQRLVVTEFRFGGRRGADPGRRRATAGSGRGAGCG